MNDMTIRLWRCEYKRTTEVRVMRGMDDVLVNADTTPRYTSAGPCGIPAPISFTLKDADCVALMNDLWNSGYRPNEVDAPGELKATLRHLEDMRTLVFKHHVTNKP